MRNHNIKEPYLCVITYTYIILTNAPFQGNYTVSLYTITTITAITCATAIG